MLSRCCAEEWMRKTTHIFQWVRTLFIYVYVCYTSATEMYAKKEENVYISTSQNMLLHGWLKWWWCGSITEIWLLLCLLFRPFCVCMPQRPQLKIGWKKQQQYQPKNAIQNQKATFPKYILHVHITIYQCVQSLEAFAVSSTRCVRQSETYR